jgi:signal transduction histidine kinase
VGEWQRAADGCITDVDTILETFGALLRIAQIESGMPARHFADVDLSELLRNVIEVYQPMAEERNQPFTAHIGPGLMVWGDRELLAQMVANLIENAVKHSPEGASIGVMTIQSPGAVDVAVIDNGTGIPVADRERVFQRFFRLSNSRSTPGSGLGLSLVRAIAALHQVSVQLTDNDPGLRVLLRFRSPDRQAAYRDSLVKHPRLRGPHAIKAGAPS